MGAEQAEVADQLRRVIAWEIEAQKGVHRPVDAMPALIADSLLDFFDVTLKAGAQLPVDQCTLMPQVARCLLSGQRRRVSTWARSAPASRAAARNACRAPASDRA